MRLHLILAVALATACAVPAFAQTVNPAPPQVTTGAATGVTPTAATIPGTVDANGTATTYHVEYGTTVSYGLKSTARNAGAGTAPSAVSVVLGQLTANTVYHYRLVASNAAGTTRSVDRSLRTASPPRPLPPVVVTGIVSELTPRSVTLTGSVNPRAVPTRYRFEYGTGTTLNRRTSFVAAGSGTVPVAVSARLTLAPNTRYSYRLTAASTAGAVNGARRSFTSPRAPALLTFALQSNRVPYEGTLVAAGSATSAGAGGVPLTLERQVFPFSGPFEQVSAQRSAGDGAYRFTVSPLLLSARFRVVARTAPVVTSIARTARTTMRVGITAKRVPNRRLRFSGEVRPVLSGANASLQRRKRGRFVTLRRVSVRPRGSDPATYRVTVSARATAARYRVIVTPPSSSGHARGISRKQRVGGLRRR